MARIPNKSIVTYQGKWPQIASFISFTSRAEYVGAVTARLTRHGLITRDVQWDTPSIFFEQDGPSVTLRLQVENGLGYGSEADIISIVRHEVYNYTGQYPLTDSIPYVQTPGGFNTSTGQPAITQPTGDDCGPVCQWFKNLTAQGFFAVGFIGIGILGAIVVITRAGK